MEKISMKEAGNLIGKLLLLKNENRLPEQYYNYLSSLIVADQIKNETQRILTQYLIKWMDTSIFPKETKSVKSFVSALNMGVKHGQ